MHELDNTVTVQKVPEVGTNSSELLGNVTIIPDDAPAGAKYGAGEILIPATSDAFPTQYIYATNRNVGTETDTRGDSVAILEYSTDGGLKVLSQFHTGIQQIRGAVFGGENNEYLIASGVVGEGGVAVFKRTEEGKNFEEVARNTDVATRTSFLWV